MHEILEQVMHYARAIWRYRWYIHLIAWPIAIVGWLFVASLPDEYESSARVYVDTKSVLRPLLRGLTVESDLENEVQMMTRTLLSRPNLEKVARMTDMDLKVKNEFEMDELVEKLRQSVKFKSEKDNIYSISYTDTNSVQAKNVVQAILTLFVESSLGDSRKDSSSAQKFLDEQIAEYEHRLYEAEERVKEFKRKNVEFMPSAGGDYFSRLQKEKEALLQAKAQLSEVEQRAKTLKRQIAGQEPAAGVSSTSNIFSGGLSHPLDGRISELEARLDELKLKYTERHPDVVSVTDTITRLKEKRKEDIAKAKQEKPELENVPILDSNPVFQQLKVSLAQTEAEIAVLNDRVKRHGNSVKELESAVDTIPQIEAELARLNRDYSINKANYEALLKRRDSAELAQKADQSSDDVKFNVIDPPRVPREPSGPNRTLFDLASLLAGLAAGLAFAVLLAQVKPTFYTTKELENSFGLPVYGSVAIIRTPRELKVRLYEVIGFFSVAALLVMVAIVILVYQESVRHLVAGILTTVGGGV